MPRIDPLISAMVSNRADAVRLADGDVAHLIKGGAQHPLTRQALAEGQLMVLLREMAPLEFHGLLEGPGPLEFVYRTSEGGFVTRVSRDAGRLNATVRPDVREEKTPNGGPHGNSSGTANGAAGNGHSPRRPPVDPAVRVAMEALLTRLVSEGGSDLHLRAGEPPIIRVFGELKRLDMEQLTAQRVEAMILAIMPDRNYDEYAATNDTDFAHEMPGLARFRGNAFRDYHGAGGVLRVIPEKVASVEDLNITPEVQNLCYLTKGLVLVTGPTGSGKSTTLGAMVDLVNRSRDDHLITIEDPIEFVHRNKRCIITQRQVGTHTGSFKAALRAALREDPDIVLVGELRDLETVSIALETAETGHLVFATLHTTTAAGTVDRIIDQFPTERQPQIRVMLADTLKGVISQVLCKRIGPGRIAAREILLSVPAVANMIREGKPFLIPSVMQTSRKLGMIQLGDVLIDYVEQRLISPQEGYIKSTDKAAFLAMLKSRGHDTSFVQS